jgi:pyridoxal phosphate-dependent aminotransferase EpsN
MPQAPFGLHTYWLSCFLVDPTTFGASRNDIIRALEEQDIEARPVWKPMHLQPLYAACPTYGGPTATSLFDRGLCLPSSSSLPSWDQDRVIEVVRRLARR